MDDLLDQLEQHKQEHVLVGWDSLDEVERNRFAEELRTLDFEQLSNLYAKRNDTQAALPSRERIAPQAEVFAFLFDQLGMKPVAVQWQHPPLAERTTLLDPSYLKL